MGFFEQNPVAFVAVVLLVGGIGGWIGAKIKERIRG